MFKTAEVLPAN